MFTYPRLDDWTSRWAGFIKDSLDLRHDLVLDWDVINCTQFGGQGIEAITGHNPYEEGGWQEKFTTSKDAVVAIKAEGFTTLDDLIASLFPEIPLAFTWPGDVVLIKAIPWGEASANERKTMPHGVALADPPFYYAVTEQGLGRGDLRAEGIRAFAIGHEVG